MKIPLTVPSIEEDDLKAVREVIKSGFLVQGEQVSSFEQKIVDYVGTKYAVAVSNCTAALHLSLLALGVRPGDIVIVTAYSWIATANVIELCGARPVFVDIQPDTFNMDPEQLEKILSDLMKDPSTRKKVKAILPVHTFGQMADMPTIIKLADHYEIPILEDAACALGATWKGRQAGTWGTMGCFSFHPRKNITTGEGGMIVTDDANLESKLKALRNHGQDPDSNTFEFIVPGFNYRMTEFQAAMGMTQFSKLDRINTSKRVQAENYRLLLDSTDIKPPNVPKASKPVFQSYVVSLPENILAYREQIIKNLKDKEIETTIGTLNMPLTDFFRKKYHYQPSEFNKTDLVYQSSLTLPIYEGLNHSQQKVVVESLLSEIDKLLDFHI